VFGWSEFCDAVDSLSHAPINGHLRAAGLVTPTALHGARPADLPIEQPTHFDSFNLRTARLLGSAARPSCRASVIDS
jgi:putative ABC transport system substrate-binding protein